MAKVSVVGAGTMGSGIAQTAAQAGWDVCLLDVSADVAAKAIAGIGKRLDRVVEKGKLAAPERDAIVARIRAGDGAESARASDLLIEAVVEDLDAKVRVLAPLADSAGANCIVASNTSSLSISKIAAGLSARCAVGRETVAGRTVGMHFFNPVPLMPLVEIIAGEVSEPASVERALSIAAAWKKTAVRAKDTPGFIVNRVARGYYLESLRMLGEGIAGVDEIDGTLKTFAKLSMGPFELMDMIGIDVNYAVSCSVWEQMGRPPRLEPHPIQRALVEQQHLGRKSKRGFYSYQTEHPVPAVPVDRRSFELPGELHEAVRRFFSGAVEGDASSTEQYIVSRVLATIINEAALAVDDGVAVEADIDIAMKLGTNYPFGPFGLADRVGRFTCAAMLRALDRFAGPGRFAPARALG